MAPRHGALARIVLAIGWAATGRGGSHTRDYIDRRVKEGLTKKEAIRCLKRYIAHEVYNLWVPETRFWVLTCGFARATVTE
jgi:hypothetical protein